MFIPLGTDAPVYHWPRGTLGVIAACAGCYFATRGDWAATEPYRLAFGSGIHPLQWLTYSFLHPWLGVLLPNLLFLWIFGIVVEGKLGTLSFLAAYLGLAAVQGAVEQLAFLHGGRGYDIGATGVIFGLLAMTMVWAPSNDVSCIYLMYAGRFGGFSARHVEVPILFLSFLYILGETIAGALWVAAGFSRNIALMHMVVVGLGFVLATALLKLGLVDCEGWDLYNVLRKNHTRSGGKRKRRSRSEGLFPGDKGWDGDEIDEVEEDAEGRPTREELRAEALRLIREAVAQEHGPAALTLYRKWVERRAIAPLPEKDHVALIKLLARERMTNLLLPLLERYVFQAPDVSDRLRLVLARVLIRDQQRPLQGSRILQIIDVPSLPDSMKPLHRELSEEAGRQREEGVLEVEGEGW